jgi:hypothetical protein
MLRGPESMRPAPCRVSGPRGDRQPRDRDVRARCKETKEATHSEAGQEAVPQPLAPPLRPGDLLSRGTYELLRRTVLAPVAAAVFACKALLL